MAVKEVIHITDQEGQWGKLDLSLRQEHICSYKFNDQIILHKSLPFTMIYNILNISPMSD